MTDSAMANLFSASAKNILFVCTGNICRSVTAEGILKGLLAGEASDILIHSAGTRAVSGHKASTSTLFLLTQWGYDLTLHRSRPMTAELAEGADIIIVMEHAHKKWLLTHTPRAQEKIILLSDFYPSSRFVSKESNIPDPIGMNEFFYENVHEMIYVACLNILDKLREPQHSKKEPRWIVLPN